MSILQENHKFINFKTAISRLANENDEIDVENTLLQYPPICREIASFADDNILNETMLKSGANELIQVLEATKTAIEKGAFNNSDRRLEFIAKLQAKIHKEFSNFIEPKVPLKLSFNADKYVIMDFFSQLKDKYVENNKPFLDMSFAQIAKFLIQSVEGFENNKAKSLTSELTKKYVVQGKKIKVTTE